MYETSICENVFELPLYVFEQIKRLIQKFLKENSTH